MGSFNFSKEGDNDNKRQLASKEVFEITQFVHRLVYQHQWDEIVKRCDYGINKYKEFPELTNRLLIFRGKAWSGKLEDSITSYNERDELLFYFNKALDDYNLQIEYDNEDYMAIYDRSLLYFIKGDSINSINGFNEVKRLNPGYFEENEKKIKNVLDSYYTGRVLFGIAFGMQKFFKKREEMYRAGYKYKFSINSRFMIDPVIIYAIPEFERDVVADIIEKHNSEKINSTRRYDFDLFSLFMEIENIKSDYLDRYFELKIYDALEMLSIIYGDILTDEEKGIDSLVEKIKKMIKMNLWE